MTDYQRKRLYGPAWTPAFAACWVRDHGTIRPRPGRPSAPANSGRPRPEDVEQLAGVIAERAGRPVTESDLRRACRWLVLGRDVPDGNTLNATDELDRVLTAFRLLANPDCLDAGQDWENPARPARRRIIHGLERSGIREGLLRGWCARFNDGEYEWRCLPDEALQRFNRYVWGRASRNGSRQVVSKGHG